MTNPLEGLEPSNLWKYFAEISAIPRESGNEKKAIDYIEKLAREKGLEYHRDTTGNILIRVPASKGYESAPAVILQGHIDMVCVKEPGHTHDFTKDGIKLIIDGDWVRADHTTLGADNGIGVAAALAMIDETDSIHPPLEILVTVDEETGMSGAMNIEPSMVTGKTLINLDSENPDIIYIGCAGGGDTVIRIPTPREKFDNGFGVKIRVSGLSGGHSGMDIVRNRANAIKLIARVCNGIIDTRIGIYGILGGVRRNVIPSEAEAIFVMKKTSSSVRNSMEKIHQSYRRVEREALEEYGANDPDIRFEHGPFDLQDEPYMVIKPKVAKAIVRLLMSLPYGVLAMSRDIPGLVETSNNIGVVTQYMDFIEMVCTTRSSVDSAKKRVMEEIESACALAGAKTRREHPYPGWKPNPDSPILKIAKETYKELFGKEPKTVAIHAGLETGFFSERFNTTNMISFGPTIEGAHSTKERVNIKSTSEFFRFLKTVLHGIAAK